MDVLNEKIVKSMEGAEKKRLTTLDLVELLQENIKETEVERKKMFDFLSEFISKGISREERKQIRKQM